MLRVSHNKTAAYRNKALWKTICRFNAADFRRSPIFLKVENKSDITAAETVNTLPIISYAKQSVIFLLPHLCKQSITRLRYILIFIYNNMTVSMNIFTGLHIFSGKIDHIIKINFTAFTFVTNKIFL